ncbi:MAG: alpha/beta hydrolase [Isosphaeraceae bacterium]|jgi:pimeloyl-ACP methyl ester carboxylesterase|nr:MAG: alpha/beta hydrolase [Isosphaeraceae bacterium]
MLQARDLTVGSVRLRVHRTTSDGPPLVLLHGVSRCGLDWLPLIPHLSLLGSIHALDQRGHGHSQKGLGAYRVRDYVEDATAYVAALDAPAILIGHSLGAMVAAGVAAALPARVQALVLEDPTFEMTGARLHETSFPDLFHAYLPHVGSHRPTDEVARALGRALVGAPGGPKLPLSATRDAASLRFLAECLKQLDPNVLTSVLDGHWMDDYDIDATLGLIACPTLLLHGEYAAGGALPEDYAERLASLILDVTRVRLPRIGHNIHSSATEAMLRPLLAFLAAILTANHTHP